ncbi:MAG: hypothetical protein DWQ07_16995 [Chloroflexi bacterium]|nr:MAG: hypothetical protein DWQ07_16995 [Chloroflexota bacterium]MBL1195102.1 hypothetical protein [Chloroflexota bacterium]NOH12388.1 hypothetical protein [Chloroflexota bacterium]
MKFTGCPSCDSPIKVMKNPRIGQRIRCPHCDADLEVTWLDPIELDWFADDVYYEFDWSEDEYSEVDYYEGRSAD